jgi:DNA-binding LacI/PurR family transcriptional regulator
MQAQALAIAVVTKFVSDYYFGGMLKGIHQITRAAGVPLLVIQDGLQDLRLPPFGAAHIAGWIVLHPGEDDTAKLVTLAASGLPVVTVATAPDTVACSSVVVDNRGDTQALVNHLIDHGHRQIACIDHGPDRWSRERYQGYLDALHERGIALDPTLVIDTAAILLDIGAPHPERCGAHAAHELIARGVPCTALVAGIDQTAIAAMHVLQEAGYRVPEDVAVVGFDDIVDAQYAQPPLTSVRTRFDAMGRAAAEHLLAVLRGERDPQPRRITAPSSVLRRRSCGCAGVDEIQARSAAAVATARDWQGALAEQLVALVVYPLAPDPGTPPNQSWPGVHTLIEALAAALQGQDSACFAAGIESAW